MEIRHQFDFAEGNAVKIGRTTGLVLAALGVLLANILVTTFVSIDSGLSNGIVWFLNFDYLPSLAIGVVAVFVCSYFMCGLAATRIVSGNMNAAMVGSVTAIAVLLASGFAGGVALVFQKTLEGNAPDLRLLVDFVLLPGLVVTFYGFLPATLLGMWFGTLVRKKTARLETAAERELVAT